MSYVFPRHSRITVPLAKSASGCYITDKDGKKYFDGSGGAAVSCLGHGDSDVNEAIQKQLSQIAFAHNSFFTSEPAEELAELLIKNSPTNPLVPGSPTAASVNTINNIAYLGIGLTSPP